MMKYKNYWAFRNNLTDLVGSNNGALGGANSPVAVKGRFGGHINNAYELQDGNHGFTKGNYSRIVFTRSDFDYEYNDSFTIGMWIKKNQDCAVNNVAISSRDYTAVGKGEMNTYIHLTSECLRMILQFSICEEVISTNYDLVAANMTAGVWYFVIFVYDGSGTPTLKLYWDGELVQTVQNANIISGNCYAAAAPNMMFGVSWDSVASNYLYDGDLTLDELFNEDSAWSAADIKTKYAQDIGIF